MATSQGKILEKTGKVRGRLSQGKTLQNLSLLQAIINAGVTYYKNLRMLEAVRAHSNTICVTVNLFSRPLVLFALLAGKGGREAPV